MQSGNGSGLVPYSGNQTVARGQRNTALSFPIRKLDWNNCRGAECVLERSLGPSTSAAVQFQEDLLSERESLWCI